MRHHHNKHICERSGKVKYATEQEAEDKLIHTQELRGRGGAKRVYQCLFCSSYHLTSRDELYTAPETSIGLKHVDKWMKLMNDTNQTENATLGTTTTVQTHKRDKTRPNPGIPGCTVVACDGRFYFEISGGRPRVAQTEQLHGPAFRTSRNGFVRPVGKGGKKRNKGRAIL